MPFRVTVFALLAALAALPAADPAPAPKVVLPGMQPTGFVQLPNQWQLLPAGKQLTVGDLPSNIQLHPSGQFAAVLHCGYRDHEVMILDLNPRGQKIRSRVTVDQSFYGLTFSPDGRQLYASGGEFDVVHVWDFDRGLLHNQRSLDVGSGARTVPAGLALSANGGELFAAGLWNDCVVRVPLDNPANKVVIPIGALPSPKGPATPAGELPSPADNRKEVDAPPAPAAVPAKSRPLAETSLPYAVLPEPGGKRLFASLWGQSAVAVIDLENNKVAAVWPTASHPTEMALSPKGDALYVACANSTQISVFDPATGKSLQTINAALYPQPLAGNTPNSLTLSPDGEVLFIANADANNLAVFNVADRATAKPMGFIPTGWYPTSVRFNRLDRTLLIANGKGMVSRANPSGPNPLGARTVNEYIATLFQGTVSVLPVPTPSQMAKLTKTAYECSPMLKDAGARSDGVAADNPIPRKLGEKSPIKNVIYIVKENRTYDQVFGDLPRGNGDPRLTLFGDDVAPNHRKLAQEFVLLDNTYVDGEISADGHEWSMGAYATDFVEKMWPLSYRGSPLKTFGYPAEGEQEHLARPAGGYLWDRAKEAGVSYRSYGEWVENGKMNRDGTFEPGTPTSKNLVGHIDPLYRSYDLSYPDQKRADRFISELKRFEAEGEMPRLQIVKLPNDHTSGTRLGAPTPRAMVADNDFAFGRIVEAVSKSKFWKETAIFVIEDDAQNGPDHVDAHRVVAFVISPYTKRKFTDSTLYSTTSLLRTMELILNLKPMSQFDAAARPMYHSFTATPDFAPYEAVTPKQSLAEKNAPGAFGQAQSEAFDLTKEDRADDLQFNEVIWRSVKGANSPMPAPVRAAFFFPVKAKKDDDD